MKKIKDAYEKLRKIKRPVLIIVEDSYSRKFYNRDRMRILYPNGSCKWSDYHSTGFYRSCFYPSGYSLNNCIKEMEDYDKDWDHKIVGIYEL